MKHIKYLILLVLLMVKSEVLLAFSSDDFDKYGLVDITSVDSSLVVALMYATSDNFVGENMYGTFNVALLHRDAAQALKKASYYLHEINPEYNLKICDAARPMSVQRKMFNIVKGTPKARYVANPSKGGGLHNYGLAVDVTIVDKNGNELSMGTPVDYLGYEANITNEKGLVAKGVISKGDVENRELLRTVMRRAGFRPLPTEWWHFNFCSLNHAHQYYKRLDF